MRDSSTLVSIGRPMLLALVATWITTATIAALVAEETGEPQLLTAAEASNFQATSSHERVVSFCNHLTETSELVHRLSLGKSVEGRDLPLLVLSKSPVATVDDVSQEGRLVVFAMANIHAGEVCGKEALLMLARDLARNPDDGLFDAVTLVFAPIYNADGNERVSRRNRAGQIGPDAGVGQRENAQGLDLNRDHVKLESPEARCLVRFLNRCDPGVVIDCHTTNGSRHRYALTYDGPRHPATDPEIMRFVREFLPQVGQQMERKSGYASTFYGNFARKNTRWETYPAEPRYNTQYIGLRQRIGVLSEAYAYAPFEDRVRATLCFVESCVRLAAQQAQEIQELLDQARERATVTDDELAEAEIAVDFEAAAFDQPRTILGYDEAAQTPRDYTASFWGDTRVTRSIKAPYAYVIPPELGEVISNLQRHGIELRDLREDVELDVEVYRVTEIDRQSEPFQGHQLVQLEVKPESLRTRIPAGSVVALTAQPLAPLLVNLLEPESRDGLSRWNFFDTHLRVDHWFPVSRLLSPTQLLMALRRSEDAGERKAITFDTLYGDDERLDLAGDPAIPIRWVDDDHYLQEREDLMHRVAAKTGRAEPLYCKCELQRALQSHEAIDEQAAKRVAEGGWLQMKEDGAGIIFRHLDDLFFASLDGTIVRRLTQSPGNEELALLSPDGQRVAFVRSNDLYVVSITDGSERQLTHHGTPLVRNGKADWVYFEEVYRRNWRAFKWSPDSRRLMFQQFDDSPVGQFAVPDNGSFLQSVERERYPKAGQPNPRVRLAVVSCNGGEITWLPLHDYSPDAMLITHFGWSPSGKGYAYIQDRAQRWLDYHEWDVDKNESKVLFRETTPAWVDNPGDPFFLDDQSFLLTSERSGWKHIYHFAADGRLLRQLTDGEWEVRRVHGLSPDQRHVHFMATKDSHLAENLYRISIKGGEVQRMSPGPGHHRCDPNPSGSRFIDIVSDRKTPRRVFLRDANGKTVRTIDTNPVPEIEEYDLQPVEFLQIKTRDGEPLEASLIKPPGFQPDRKYPVWLLTYGGPHAPSLHDAWYRGRPFEQLLAHMGIVAFRCDPRSASGKGAKSTWIAYRQLGVPELRDLEDAVQWLREQPFVDADRIGMSGHSYGGFLTAYALTHSDKFVAGIAGAPVTDWRNYDTIYTERYMDTPQNNPEGYQKTSVVEAAAQLHGKLLLAHGARDDNVHFANSLQLAGALQDANKSFEMMVYPQSRHGIQGDHYQRLRVDFIRRSLGLGEATQSAE